MTRLTVLKSLCREPEVANRFVCHLAQCLLQKIARTLKRPPSQLTSDLARRGAMIDRAVTALEEYLDAPSDEKRSALRSLFHELVGEQNEHRKIHEAPVRIITDSELLLVEYALGTVPADQGSAPVWAYQTARHYAERYDSGQGTGLTAESASLLEDIAEFWLQEFGLDAETIHAPAKTRTTMAEKPAPVKTSSLKGMPVKFTQREGQFLAFIHLYCELHHQGPAELDMVKYFRVTPPAVHDMVVRLEHLGFVTREPGVPRSVRVAIPEVEIPALSDSAGPAC